MSEPKPPLLDLSVYGPYDYAVIDDHPRGDISTMDPAKYWEIMEEHGALEEGD